MMKEGYVRLILMKSTPLLRPASLLLAFLLLAMPLVSGCAVALLGAGVVGGYAVAKDMEDGALIDPPREGNKGWFGGGK